MNAINIWLDDERNPTDKYVQTNFGSSGSEVWCQTVAECKELILQGIVEKISFDNDLGENQEEGHQLASWIEEQAFHKNIKPMKWQVHSMNNIARNKITKIMQNAERYWNA